ncbi:MAG: hypothetical protein HC869_13675 [Rhodospirillales bacterium]|nr:hypothetical protein [Rhodospirillales bacterium]
MDVVINGAVVQHLRLPPGNYNLSDLPLAAGANEVQLVISDDTGDRRTLAFTTFFDSSLLAAGKSEWALSSGVPSYFRDNERVYRENEFIGTAFHRYGITDHVTSEVHLQGDNYVIMGGTGLFWATPWGFWGLQPAASASDLGAGFGVKINWELVNFRGVAGSWYDTRETLRLATEYRSSHFRTPGEFLTTAGGVLFPQFNYWLRLTGSYTIPLGGDVTATLGARYQLADDDQLILSPYTIKGDRYGADLSLSSPLSTNVSASLTLGYSNESYLRYVSTRDHDNDPEFRVMLRFYVRPDEKTRIATSYDSLNRSTTVSAYRGEGRGLDRWETTVDVAQTGNDEKATANGAVTYYGNRAEVRVAHSTGWNGTSWDTFNPRPWDHRTSLRVGSSLAFADGQFAVGQPIRGGGFAIVYPHESIAGKEITVGTNQDIRARSDALSPSIVTSVPSYTHVTIPVDVADLPIGYSLGAGVFDIYPPYRAGYALEVGSAYSVSAYGTLVFADGSPVALLTGVTFPVGNPEKQVAIFTNRAGRFGAEGLAPGKWIIEMATDESPTYYHLEVPRGADGLFNAGALQPKGRE